MEVRITKNF